MGKKDIIDIANNEYVPSVKRYVFMENDINAVNTSYINIDMVTFKKTIRLYWLQPKI